MWILVGDILWHVTVIQGFDLNSRSWLVNFWIATSWCSLMCYFRIIFFVLLFLYYNFVSKMFAKTRVSLFPKQKEMLSIWITRSLKQIIPRIELLTVCLAYYIYIHVRPLSGDVCIICFHIIMNHPANSPLRLRLRHLRSSSFRVALIIIVLAAG